MTLNIFKLVQYINKTQKDINKKNFQYKFGTEYDINEFLKHLIECLCFEKATIESLLFPKMTVKFNKQRNKSCGKVPLEEFNSVV